MNSRPFPDSGLAKAAATLLVEVSDPSMVNHCLRTYRFGEALGEKLALKPDRETLYLAALLHDLGLEPPYDGPGDFESNGAKAAEAFMLSHGAKDSVAALVRSAIEVHTRLAAGKDERAEVKLLHLGAAVDAIGLRLDEIPPKLVEQVLNDHPRLDWKNVIVKILEKQIAAKPHCRLAEDIRKTKFFDLIRNAPYAE